MSDSVRVAERMGSLSAADAAPAPRYSDAVIAYTILRLTFGANIMLHGVSRLFVGHAAFLGYLNHYFEKTPLIPAGFLPLFATVLPPVEGTLGLLLLLGLATRFSLIAGGLVVTALAIGTNLAQDWNVAGLVAVDAQEALPVPGKDFFNEFRALWADSLPIASFHGEGFYRPALVFIHISVEIWVVRVMEAGAFLPFYKEARIGLALDYCVVCIQE